MIDLLLAHGMDEGLDEDFESGFAAYEVSILTSAGGGDAAAVGKCEAAVRDDPAATFALDGAGAATLTAGGRSWRAGRGIAPKAWFASSRVFASSNRPATSSTALSGW